MSLRYRRKDVICERWRGLSRRGRLASRVKSALNLTSLGIPSLLRHRTELQWRRAQRPLSSRDFRRRKSAWSSSNDWRTDSNGGPVVLHPRRFGNSLRRQFALQPISAWVSIDDDLHRAGRSLTILYSTVSSDNSSTISVERRNGNSDWDVCLRMNPRPSAVLAPTATAATGPHSPAIASS